MKSKVLVKAVIGIVAVATLMLFQPASALAQSNGFTITPVVKRGDPSPDGGRFFICIDNCAERITGSHAFNNRQDVSIQAATRGSCFYGIFLASPEKSELIANPCQQTPLGVLNSIGDVNINDHGQAALFAGLPIMGAVTLLFYSEGQINKIVTIEDRTPTGAVFRGCGFSPPSINNKGEVAFGACAEDSNRRAQDGIYLFAEGQIRKVVTYGDPSPIGGFFALNFVPAVEGIINNNSEILFDSGVIIELEIKEKFGLFLATGEGVKKVVTDGDPMPGGNIVEPQSLGIGDLNDRGEVAFTVLLDGPSDTGIFLNSNGQISKIMAQGESTPIGGIFSTLNDPELIERFLFIRPRINNNGAVAFKAKVKDGSSRLGVFLASPKAILKVVAIGDKLPTGEEVREINSFALNDLGQVAFFAGGKKGGKDPIGLYVATPSQPEIKSIKLKRKQGALELRVNGKALIANDTIIEINGVALGELSYPAEFKQDGGTTTRVVSRDARLEQLISPGQSVQVTAFNPLTNLRSASRSFTR